MLNKMQNNFKQMLLALKKTQKALAKELEIHENSVVNYLKGRRAPDVDLLRKITQLYGINLHWLITGDGEMYLGRRSEGNQVKEPPNQYNHAKIAQLQAENEALKAQIAVLKEVIKELKQG